MIGERWSALVVRELCLGPRRYSDLLNGLPGIPTNLLATRLRALRAAGIIDKRTLPPPTAVTVYELTEAGQALRPALQALRVWGVQYAPAPADGDAARPSWVLLSASGRATAMREGSACDLQVGEEMFHLGADGSTLTILGGPASSADATVTLSADSLYRLMSGRAAGQMTVVGDPEVARRALETLDGALVGLV